MKKTNNASKIVSAISTLLIIIFFILLFTNILSATFGIVFIVFGVAIIVFALVSNANSKNILEKNTQKKSTISDKITESIEKIKRNFFDEENVKEKETSSYCEYCGTEIPKGDIYCKACGAPKKNK